MFKQLAIAAWYEAMYSVNNDMTREEFVWLWPVKDVVKQINK